MSYKIFINIHVLELINRKFTTQLVSQVHASLYQIPTSNRHRRYQIKDPNTNNCPRKNQKIFGYLSSVSPRKVRKSNFSRSDLTQFIDKRKKKKTHASSIFENAQINL